MEDRQKGMWKELESDHSRAVKPGQVGQGMAMSSGLASGDSAD